MGQTYIVCGDERSLNGFQNQDVDELRNQDAADDQVNYQTGKGNDFTNQARARPPAAPATTGANA